MNRYCSYKKSLQKYINKRSCLKSYFNSTETPTEMYTFIMNLINEDSFIIPTIFLTIVNTQNKKYNISMQCYYSASAIMFYCVLSKFVSQEKQIIARFGDRAYYEAINNLVSCACYSINQSMKTIKSNNHKNLFDIYIDLMNIHCRLVNTSYLLKPVNLINTGNVIKKNADIGKWYKYKTDEVKDRQGGNENNNPASQVIKFKEIKDDEYSEYFSKTLGCLCELSFTMAWIQGGGKMDEINGIKNISRYFAMMLKISIDFECLESDLNVSSDVSGNHVINYGIQKSYNVYLENKYQFIEKCISAEIYTNTMQEIVTLIDKSITLLVDNISPDIISNMSSC